MRTIRVAGVDQYSRLPVNLEGLSNAESGHVCECEKFVLFCPCRASVRYWLCLPTIGPTVHAFELHVCNEFRDIRSKGYVG